MCLRGTGQTIPCPKPAVISLSLCPSGFKNKALGSSWFGGVRKSPLQLLHDLDQVSGWDALYLLDRKSQPPVPAVKALSSVHNGASCVVWKSNFPTHYPSHHTRGLCLFCVMYCRYREVKQSQVCPRGPATDGH